MTSTKLLVVDIDGTICGDSNQISPPVLQALHQVQQEGIPVAIATGRMYRSAVRFHQAIGSQLPIIAYQGALIKCPRSRKVYRHQRLCASMAHRLLDCFEQMPFYSQLSIHLYINDHLYVNSVSANTHEYEQRSRVKAIPVGDLRPILITEPTKVLALAPTPAHVDELLTRLQRQFTPEDVYLTKSMATFFEAAHAQVNKGNAVRYLAEEILGIQAREVMAIGDNYNDLEMLAYAGLGIAMGNAPASVQTVANWIAPSVNQDGVAAAIRKFLL